MMTAAVAGEGVNHLQVVNEDLSRSSKLARGRSSQAAGLKKMESLDMQRVPMYRLKIKNESGRH